RRTAGRSRRPGRKRRPARSIGIGDASLHWSGSRPWARFAPIRRLPPSAVASLPVTHGSGNPMATLIPSRSTCLSRMTSGERRCSGRLDDKLADESLCWYDVPIGPRYRHPDFVVLHPSRGFLVLEVKAWKPDTIAGLDRDRAVINTERGRVTEA